MEAYHSLRIASVEVSSFKNFAREQNIVIAAEASRNVDRENGNLTVLVGKNGSGKSSVLDGT